MGLANLVIRLPCGFDVEIVGGAAAAKCMSKCDLFHTHTMIVRQRQSGKDRVGKTEGDRVGKTEGDRVGKGSGRMRKEIE